MAVLLAFAFLSGVITILSPCILPVLPIVLSGGVGAGKARPFGVLAGFVASFTVFTLTLTVIVQTLNIPPDALRLVAVVLIVSFGLVMLVPRLTHGFELIASRIAGRATAKQPSRSKAPGSASAPKRSSTGFLGGVLVGVSLGLVWTPCVGPIMASVISLAVTQRVDGGAALITIAYSLGTAIPMFAVMLGGRVLINRVPILTRNTPAIQRGFGVLMIIVGVAIGFGWDRQFQTAVLRVLPNYGTGLTAIENAAPVQDAIEARASADSSDQAGTGSMMMTASGTGTYSPGSPPKNGELGDFGMAPALVARGPWLNTEGLPNLPNGEEGQQAIEMEDLRGHVVLVDFWTYSCVNCVRTIPYLKAWYEEYGNQGLVIIGVHTPEFEFEKTTANVARALKDLGIDWPVVQDNDFSQWRAYSNRYWPAHYFIDAAGRVRYYHFGEGEYETSERVIRALLSEARGGNSGGAELVSMPAPRFESRTPETYLGYARTSGFTSAVPLAPEQTVEYRPAGTLDNGQWSLDGSWRISREYAVPQDAGVLQLGFHAKNVFLVIEPQGQEGRIVVRVDGLPSPDTEDVHNGLLLADESRLYQLVGLEKAGPHVLSLEVQGRLRLFAFTFG